MRITIYKTHLKKREKPDVLCIGDKLPSIDCDTPDSQIVGSRVKKRVTEVEFGPITSCRLRGELKDRLYGRGDHRLPFGYSSRGTITCNSKLSEIPPVEKREKPYCPKFRKGRCGKDILINPKTW